MKKLFEKWIIPICLLIMISSQIREYLIKSEIHTGNWAIVVVLIPWALKGFEVNVSNYLERLLTIIAILLVIYTVFITTW